MNNWEKYTLAAVIVTAAGFTYIKSSHRDIPSDLRDAVADNTSAEEFNNLVGVRASEIKPVNDVPMPKTSKTHNCKTGHEKMLREFSITDLVDPDFSETKSAKSSQITAETERDFKKLIQIAGWKNVKRAPIDYVQATNSKNGVSANFILLKYDDDSFIFARTFNGDFGKRTNAILFTSNGEILSQVQNGKQFSKAESLNCVGCYAAVVDWTNPGDRPGSTPVVDPTCFGIQFAACMTTAGASLDAARKCTVASTLVCTTIEKVCVVCPYTPPGPQQ